MTKIITSKDKIAVVLKEHPELKGKLIERSPRYKWLENPLVFKTVARVASVSDMVRVVGEDLDELLDFLNTAIGQREAYLAYIAAPGDGQTTSQFVNFQPEAPPEIEYQNLDARQANPGEFLPTVTGKAQSIPEGEGLHIIQSFEPIPLYSVFGGMDFEHETVQGDEGEYHVYFYKTPTALSEAEAAKPKSLSAKMGGHLDLKPERVEAIVGIVQAFYGGENLNALRQRFEMEIGSISPVEFAFVEQKMTELGVSDAKFKARVEELLGPFKKTLVQAQTPELPADHPIHTFKQEKAELTSLVEEMREMAKADAPADEA